MEKCCIIGCESPAVYYNEIKKLNVCVGCKIEYYSNIKFERISDYVDQKQTINTILLYFKTIHEYMKTYPLEGIFKGFGDELKEFEIKTEELKEKLKYAKDHDLQEEVDSFESDLLKLKKQIDLSEMMKNFTSHQFQIQIERLEKNQIHKESKEEGIEEYDDIRVTALTKENISEGLKGIYEERIRKLNEEYDRENKKLRNKIEKTKMELGALDKTKLEILKEYNELKQREDKIREVNEALKTENNQLKEVNKVLIISNNKLTNETNKLKEKCTKLNERYEDLDSRYSKLNKELKAGYEMQYKTQIEMLESEIYTQNSNIENKSDEIAIYKTKVKDKEKRIDILEKELKCKEAELQSIDVDNLPLRILYKYYANKIGKPFKDIYGNTDIHLSLCYDSHKQVLSVAKLFKLPPIRHLIFEHCDTNNADLLEFLENSFQSLVKTLTFGWAQSGQFQPLEYYFSGIGKAFKYVTEEIVMNNWTFTKNGLQRVVKASSSVEKLAIRASKIDLDSELDFSGPNYSIKYFGFSWLGSHLGEGWTEHPEKLERIIKAISFSTMKYSLETLSVHCCGLGTDKVKEMLNQYGMYSVNAVSEDSVPENLYP